jgi:hypothetical protein
MAPGSSFSVSYCLTFRAIELIALLAALMTEVDISLSSERWFMATLCERALV